MRASMLWKLAFSAAVLLPFLPAISIYAVAGLARIKGCIVGSEETCVAEAISLSRTIVEVPLATPGLAVSLFVAMTWLALCYLCIGLGWKRTISRLLFGLAVTLVFAGLPYFASLPTLGTFIEPQCKPNGGGFGVCGLFHGNVGGGEHILAIQIWISVCLPLGLIAFVIYTLPILSKRNLRSSR